MVDLPLGQTSFLLPCDGVVDWNTDIHPARGVRGHASPS